MKVEPLAGFRHFPTHHCVTGSMRHVYVYNGLELCEEMLLGLGAGVSFIYWHSKGQLPFLGGRGGTRPPLMEEVTGQRTGVNVGMHTTSSPRKARKALLEMLAAGQPVMIGCDMGFLPYFDFGGEEYHFGGHAIVICGYDPESDQVLVADRDEALHPVPMTDLERARGSTFKPFPPKNLWYTFEFAAPRPPTAGDVRQAIREMAGQMLRPPISNIGVKGIAKAAGAVRRWPQRLGDGELRPALVNAYIMISAVGGSGGGCFRYMLGRFLGEAAEICGDPRLERGAAEFRRIGDCWEELAEAFRHASEATDPTSLLDGPAALLENLADLEGAAWQHLDEIVG